MVQFMTNAQLEEKERAESAKKVKAEDGEPSLLTRSLANHLRIKWEAAKRAKINTVETQMFTNLRQAMGVYETTKLKAIREIGGSDVFIGVTDVKCRNAIAWIKDILFQPNSKPWAVEPTPVPELGPDDLSELEAKYTGTYLNTVMENTSPDEPINMQGAIGQVKEKLPQFRQDLFRFIRDKAEEKAKIIERELNDKLVEGGWYEALDQCIYDIVVIKNGFIKGPIKRFRNVHKLVKDGENGEQRVDVVKEVVDEWDRRSPFDIYPEPDSNGINDGYYFDHVSYRRSDLQALIGVDGFSESEIRAVLREHVSGGLREWTGIEGDRADVENKSSDSFAYSDKIDCLEYVGPVPGSFLIDWGINSKGKVVEDADLDYETTCWFIGNHVIKAIVNEDALGKRNMATAGYDEVADSFWHNALPEKIASVQSVVNAAGRAMVNNLGMGCLTGDTVVYRANVKDRKYSTITMLELWNLWEEKSAKLERLRIRSLNEDTGEIFANKIVKVYKNGIADVYEVITEKGYKIKATAGHRFMNDAGEWQELQYFDIGSMIAVNGQSVPLPKKCIDCGAPTKGKGIRCRSCAMKVNHPRMGDRICVDCSGETSRYDSLRCRKCASQIENSAWNQRQVEMSKVNFNASATTARFRYDCKSKKKDFCEFCGVRINDDPTLRLEQHHKDRSPWNNLDENLQTLCALCHHGVHAKEDSAGDAYLHTYLSYDTIVSIEHCGREMVYNLQMEAPWHNYVSSGYHNKNSGPQVEINLDRLRGGDKGDTRLIPWKRWLTTNRQQQTGTAINFWQPQMHAQEIMDVLARFVKLADEHSGVPAYAHGDPSVGGAGNTASGLSMLISQASRAIKAVMRNIDLHIIIPTIQSLYNSLLEDPKYADMVGDIHLVAKGSQALVEKEQRAVRMIELINASQAPINAQVLGVKGLQYLWTELAKTYEIDPDKLIAGNMNPQQNPATAPGTPGAPEMPGVPGMPATGEATGEVPGGQLGLGAPGSAPGMQTVGLAGEVPSGGAAQLIPGQGGHPTSAPV